MTKLMVDTALVESGFDLPDVQAFSRALHDVMGQAMNAQLDLENFVPEPETPAEEKGDDDDDDEEEEEEKEEKEEAATEAEGEQEL